MTTSKCGVCGSTATIITRGVIRSSNKDGTYSYEPGGEFFYRCDEHKIDSKTITNSVSPPNNTVTNEDTPYYELRQYGNVLSKYYKYWYVVGFNIPPNPKTMKYLSENGEWFSVMNNYTNPNTNFHFSTNNAAQIALAKTGLTDSIAARKNIGKR